VKKKQKWEKIALAKTTDFCHSDVMNGISMKEGGSRGGAVSSLGMLGEQFGYAG
jgi:hypothetical protein